MWAKHIVLTCLLTVCALCAAAVSGYDIATVMQGILSVESGGHQYSINDNATRRSYKFTSKSEAVRMAKYLLDLDHNIDMGPFQINSIQLKRGWKVEDLFESGFSRNAAETVFTEWKNAAIKRYGDTVLAWQRAIGAYNSGGSGLRNGNPTYTGKVMRAMGLADAPLDTGERTAPATAITASKALASALFSSDDDEADEDEQLDLSKMRVRNSNADKGLLGLLVAALVLLLIVLGVPLIKGILAIARVSSAASKRMTKINHGQK